MTFEQAKNTLLNRHEWIIVGTIHEAMKCPWTEEEVRIFVKNLPGYSVFDVFAALPEYMDDRFQDFYRELEELTRIAGETLTTIKDELLELVLDNMQGE